MGNYFADNRPLLKKRHYSLRANATHFWFNISSGKLKEYYRDFGDRFCIIVFRNGPTDDAYVIPISRIGRLLRKETLMPDVDGRRRWMGSIEDGQLDIRQADEVVDVADCYNARHYLQG